MRSPNERECGKEWDCGQRLRHKTTWVANDRHHMITSAACWQQLQANEPNSDRTQTMERTRMKTMACSEHKQICKQEQNKHNPKLGHRSPQIVRGPNSDKHYTNIFIQFTETHICQGSITHDCWARLQSNRSNCEWQARFSRQATQLSRRMHIYIRTYDIHVYILYTLYVSNMKRHVYIYILYIASAQRGLAGAGLWGPPPCQLSDVE